MTSIFSEQSKKPAACWSEPGFSSNFPSPHLVDTTMLYAPRSGGVKRYLLAKKAWLGRHRPDIRHTLVVPGAVTGFHDPRLLTIASARLPFGDGYRCPISVKLWSEHLIALKPDLIETGDPYGPGHAALKAGQALGVPVIGFCHSDPAALAAKHLGAWIEPSIRRQWAKLFQQLDHIIAPSRHIADRLHEAGIFKVSIQPLGVDPQLFYPERAEKSVLRDQLKITPKTKLLVFAGRPAKEKNIPILLEMIDCLGDDYHLLLIHAGKGYPPQKKVSFMDYVREPKDMARILASCDAFVHASDREPFGLIALEAMACGLPIVGIASGGIAELIDNEVGLLAEQATPKAMAKAVVSLFDKDLEAFAKAGRKKIITNYSWDVIFQKLSELYAHFFVQNKGLVDHD